MFRGRWSPIHAREDTVHVRGVTHHANIDRARHRYHRQGGAVAGSRARTTVVFLTATPGSERGGRTRRRSGDRMKFAPTRRLRADGGLFRVCWEPDAPLRTPSPRHPPRRVGHPHRQRRPPLVPPTPMDGPAPKTQTSTTPPTPHRRISTGLPCAELCGGGDCRNVSRVRSRHCVVVLEIEAGQPTAKQARRNGHAANFLPRASISSVDSRIFGWSANLSTVSLM
jgi:hypothetical protein